MTNSYMRVGALRALLEPLADNLLVVLSRDGEGNGYSPLADHSDPNDTLYHADTTWMGEISHPSQAEEEEEDGWGYSDEGVPALVLWPVN